MMPFLARFLLSIVALAVSTHAHDIIKGKYKSYYQGNTKTCPLKSTYNLLSILITIVSRCQAIGPRLIQCIALDIMRKDIQVLNLQGLPVLPMIIVALLWKTDAQVISFADAR